MLCIIRMDTNTYLIIFLDKKRKPLSPYLHRNTLFVHRYAFTLNKRCGGPLHKVISGDLVYVVQKIGGTPNFL